MAEQGQSVTISTMRPSMGVTEICPKCQNTWKRKERLPFAGNSIEVNVDCDCPGAVEHRQRDLEERVRKAEAEKQKQGCREAELQEKARIAIEAEQRERDARCPGCGGDGFVHHNPFEYCACEYGLRRRLADFENTNPLPERYRMRRLADFDGGIQARVKGIHFDQGQGLVIYGPVGTGKTALAVATLYHLGLTENPRPRMMFVSVPQLLAEIRSGYDKGSDADRGIMRRALDADVLVLDDFGAERVTDWVQEQQYTVINHRYNKMLPIIATTNLPKARLAAHIGDRAASRLWEMCEVLKLEGADRRLAQ